MCFLIFEANGETWVNTMTLSSEILSEHVDEWKVPIELRAPQSKEVNRPHFTLIKITDLNFSFDDFDTGTEKLRKTLGHIYHYYTHPKDKPQIAEKEEEEEVEEVVKKPKQSQKKKKAAKATKGNNFSLNLILNRLVDEEFEPVIDEPDDPDDDRAGLYDIKVQGKHLHKHVDDLESLYLTRGKNQVEKKLKIVDDNGRQSTALLRLLYFPFNGELESFPVPLDSMPEPKEGISKDKAKDELARERAEREALMTVPLMARRPGVEVFWNERLIKEAHIPLLQA
jgi:hypothetical protein